MLNNIFNKNKAIVPTITLGFVFVCLLFVGLFPYPYRPEFFIAIRNQVIPVQYILFSITGVWFLLFFALNVKTHETKPPVGFYLAIFFLLLPYFISTLFISPDMVSSAKIFLGLIIRGVSIGLASYILCRYFNHSVKIEKFLVFFAGLITLGAMYEVLTGFDFIFKKYASSPLSGDLHLLYQGIAVGALGQPLAFSNMILMLFPFALTLWESQRKTIYLIIILLIIATITLTLRRSAYVLLLLNLCWFYIPRKSWKILMGFLCMFILSIVLINIISPSLSEKMLSRFSVMATIKELAQNNRGKSYKITAEIVEKNPMIGLGPGNFKKEYNRYVKGSGNFATPDSQYLRAAAETGLIGLICFVGFVGFGFYKLWISRKYVFPYLMSYTSACLGMIICDTLYWGQLQVVFWIIFGSAIGKIYSKTRS